MQSAKLSGGSTHVRYDHFRYPRIIDAICPFCSNPSSLTHTEAPNNIDFLDIDLEGRNWNFKCNSCFRREAYTWDKTKEIELLYKIDVKNEIIWAWNKRHLQYLISVFDGTETTKGPWANFKTYINKSWLTKIKKSADINKLRSHLQVY